MGTAHSFGRRGEEIAASYLTAAGLRILDRNWRWGGGELDIVAADGDTLVVCEVKARSSTRYGSPSEAVTEVKTGRLRRTTEAYLTATGRPGATVRFDLVGVDRAHGRLRVVHLRDVL